MPRLSLSKKGFDSTYGGGPSPILRDGRMLSFPIPEEKAIAPHTTYKTLRHGHQSYADLLSTLGYADIGSGSPAHLDPDLIAEARTRSSDWRGMFGQIEQAESHLSQQGVDVGSLFLFWGWFEHEDGDDVFCNRRGFSAIFGYLEVDHIIVIGRDAAPFKADYHPHFSEGYPRKRNRVYVARKQLSFNSQKPGWGVFRYSERLRLSRQGQSRSSWRLPACFHPDNGCTLSYVTTPTRWSHSTDHEVHVTIPARGQEFVTELSGPIAQWAQEIINETEIWTPTESGGANR
jgi:hypothetical protein